MLIGSIRELASPTTSLHAGAAQPDGLVVAQAASCTSENLLTNADAETGPVGVSPGAMEPPTGWETTGSLRILAYGTSTYPKLSDPGPPAPGQALFIGGPASLTSTITQRIDLASHATAIDDGRLSYALCGWLGGFGTQDDAATLSATFEDGLGTALGSGSIGPVLSADRGDVTALVERSTQGAVPTGARSAVVVLLAQRVAGNSNDGYADNLHFSVAEAEPEPEPEPEPPPPPDPDPVPQPPPSGDEFPDTLQILTPGFNLVGWTGLPVDPASFADSIGPSFEAVFAWDSGTERFQSFRTSAPSFLNDLSVIHPGIGLWVLVSGTGASLRLPRLPLPDGVPLQQGLNLVVWSGSDGAPVAEAIANTAAITSVAAFDAQTGQFRSFSPAAPDFVNTLSELSTGHGLWVRATAATRWLQTSGVEFIRTEVSALGERLIVSFETDRGLFEVFGLNTASASVPERVVFTEAGSETPWTVSFNDSGWVDFVVSPTGEMLIFEYDLPTVVLHLAGGGDLVAWSLQLSASQVALLEELRADVMADRERAGLDVAQRLPDEFRIINWGVNIDARELRSGAPLCCFSLKNVRIETTGPRPWTEVTPPEPGDPVRGAFLEISWPLSSLENRIADCQTWNFHNAASQLSRAVTYGGGAVLIAGVFTSSPIVAIAGGSATVLGVIGQAGVDFLFEEETRESCLRALVRDPDSAVHITATVNHPDAVRDFESIPVMFWINPVLIATGGSPSLETHIVNIPLRLGDEGCTQLRTRFRTSFQTSQIGTGDTIESPFLPGASCPTPGPVETGNRIVNGDAEAGPSGQRGEPYPSGASATELNGWVSTLGDPRAIVYGIPSVSGGWPDDQRDMIPPNAGKGFFAGGFVESSILTQTIDVSADAAAIDAGGVRFTLSGWLGGFATQNDHASLDIEFHDASGGFLGDASIGGPCGLSSAVCAGDRGGGGPGSESGT